MFSGYPDFDVTSEQFYPIQNYSGASTFMSIYDLEGGLELTGQYFFDGGSSDDMEIYLIGNNLMRVNRHYNHDSRLLSYEHEMIVETTNIPRFNNYSVGDGTGIVSYAIDLEDFPSNTAPIVSNANGKSAFSAVPTNIQLEVNDQDGDALTYTIR